MSEMALTKAASERCYLSDQLSAHLAASDAETARLKREIAIRDGLLRMTDAGIDTEKVAMAETILAVTDYSRGGKDRQSVIDDAVKQLSTGEPIRQRYTDIWQVFFGTKDYDAWCGQRSDHDYGYGPRHGSIVFSVGLHKDIRNRVPRALSSDEVEAAIYYLLNIEAIQAAKSEPTHD